MPKAAQTFHVTDPETGRPVVYRGPGKGREEGDDVPLSVAARVGDHVLAWGDDEERPAKSTASEGTEFDGEAFDQAVAAKVASEVDVKVAEAVEQAVADTREAEKAAFKALIDAEDEFDPDAVNADEVKTYLEGLDRDTAAGCFEYDRVFDAEKAGKNRSTAFPS
jgi:hypothetical protein